jgi:hypothetical protein
MSIIVSQFSAASTKVTYAVSIAVSSTGYIYIQGGNTNDVAVYTYGGTYVSSVSAPDQYFSFCTDYSNNRIYCAGVSSFAAINTTNNTLATYSSAWLNDVAVGPDGFVYAVTNSGYNIRRINPSNAQYTVIFTATGGNIQSDNYGIFGGCVIDNNNFIYCTTRGIGYVYKFDLSGSLFGLYSRVNSAYGNTFSMTYDDTNNIIYMTTVGNPSGVYIIDKYGKSSLYTTLTGGSHGVFYDKMTNKIVVSTFTSNIVYILNPYLPPSTVTYNINKANLMLHYPLDVDMFNYTSGLGVNDVSTNLVGISKLYTMMTNGSLQITGGSTQLFQLPNITFASKEITISIWVRCPVIPTGFSRIFDFGNGPGVNNTLLSFRSGGDTFFQSGSTFYYTSFTLTDTLWHHYCVTTDASGTTRFYVDGVARQFNQSGTMVSTIISNPSPSVTLTKCYLGKSNYTSDPVLNAYFNQFILMNRVITSTELSYLSSFYANIRLSSKDTGVFVIGPDYPCFLEGSKILRLNVEYDEDEYIPVEKLKRGDLIKTATCGYKAVAFIGRKKLKDPTNDPVKKNRLYTFKSNGFSPLSLTGEHCTLHKKLTDEKRRKVREYMGDDFITEEFYRVPACLDDRAEPYAGKGPVTIWHFALEHNNLYNNYAVYANGILVETCSIDYLLKHSNMELL